MPQLHAAHAELEAVAARAGTKLEIISVSFDHDAAKVAQFRADTWPMPWAHAVPDPAAHKRLSAAFGIVGIPTMVLVGADGTILASSPHLDGASFGDIARQYL